MGIWIAAVMATACLTQDEYARGSTPYSAKEEATAVEGVLLPRVGVWTGRDFKFQATRSDGFVATSDQQALFSASLMGGVQIQEHVRILGMIEGDVASKITAEVGGIFLGWHQRPKERYGKGVPDEATIYAGPVVGKLAVHESGFGDFDNGIGVAAGMTFGWALSSNLTLDLIGEYRYLKFDYKKDVTAGDDSIGGHAGWFGVGLDVRF